MAFFDNPWASALISCFLVAIVLFECLTLGRLTRKALKLAILFFTVMEIAAVKLMQRIIRPRFVLTGECQECGDCCRSILGSPPQWVRRSWLMNVDTHYHRLAHRFEVRATTPDGSVLFECGYLQSDGRCMIYRFRPLLCRNYPVIPFYHEPMLLPGCSYSVAPRVVAEMTPHPRLPILNAHVAVHHPSTITTRELLPEADDFHLVDVSTDP